MLSSITERVLAWARVDVRLSAFNGPWLGLARTLLALGTLGTLLLTPTSDLFNHLRYLGQAPFCNGLSSAGLFCLGESNLDFARLVAIVILVVVAAGWRPAWTAIPHWWVSYSVFHGIGLPDGGDQITMIISGLLVPILLLDRRKWHWRPVGAAAQGLLAAASWAAIWAIRLQVSFLYLQAGVSKLYVPEWRDGTALYYWSTNVMFGASSALEPVAAMIYDSPFFLWSVTAFTMALELSLGIAILLPRWTRLILFLLGVLLHFCIGVAIGLWSFAFAMFGALILLLVPLDGRLGLTWLGKSRSKAAQDAGSDTVQGDLLLKTPLAERPPAAAVSRLEY